MAKSNNRITQDSAYEDKAAASQCMLCRIEIHRHPLYCMDCLNLLIHKRTKAECAGEENNTKV